MPYSEKLKDHFTNPRNVGALPDADASAEQTNPVCGDRLQLFLRISDGRISEARFLAYGCPPTIACGSALTEMVTGMKTEDAARLDRRQLIEVVGGVPARKGHAAALAVETLRAALGV